MDIHGLYWRFFFALQIYIANIWWITAGISSRVDVAMEKTLVPWHPMWIPSVSGPAFFVPHFVRPTPPNKTEQKLCRSILITQFFQRLFFLDNVGISHIQLSYSKMAGWWWLEPWNFDPMASMGRGNGIAKWPLPFFVLRSQAKCISNDSHWMAFTMGFFAKHIETPSNESNFRIWNGGIPNAHPFEYLFHLVLTGWCFHARQWVQKAEAILIQHGKPRHGFFAGWFQLMILMKMARRGDHHHGQRKRRDAEHCTGKRLRSATQLQRPSHEANRLMYNDL